MVYSVELISIKRKGELVENFSRQVLFEVNTVQTPEESQNLIKKIAGIPV